MAPRFFSDTPLPRDKAFPRHVVLGDAIAAHIRVLRLDVGAPVALFDGLGGEFHGVIEAIGKREVTVLLARHDPVERESPLDITLVQALATGDKMDLIVQKAVELGANAVQPIVTARATMKLSSERADKKVEHWRAVATAACEQCGRNRVPAIHALRDWAAWWREPFNGVRVLLHPSGGQALAALPAAQSIALMIGPEGGFDDSEIALAQKQGALLATFGPRVLRTETAGLAALAALQARAGDLK
jgi:16S rRNA (uracil1498-N3)-methyltransferase